MRPCRSLCSIAAPWIRSVARIDQRIVRDLDPVSQVAGEEQQGFLRFGGVCYCLGQRDGPEVNHPAVGGPRLGWVPGLVARIGELSREAELHPPLREPRRQ